MEDSTYLIALGLYLQAGKRFMPINGKSISKDKIDESFLIDISKSICLELFTRIWNKSDENPLQRIKLEEGIFVIQIPMDLMNDKLPLIKSEWINSGDNNKLITQLKTISKSLSILKWERYKGIEFVNLT